MQRQTRYYLVFATRAVQTRNMSREVFHNPQIRKVFIVSGGRTATTLFGHRLTAAFPRIFSIHEPDRIDAAQSGARGTVEALAGQGLWRMGVLKGLGFAGTRNLSLKRARGSIDRAAALEWLVADRRHLGALDCDVYVEANYQLFGVVPDLVTLPNSHAILLLRDPATWIQSWLKKKWYSRADWLTRLDALGMKRITPRNVGTPDDRWESFTRTEKLAWVWGYLAAGFVDQQAGNPDRVSLYRFENLTARGDDTLEQKTQFLENLLGRTPDQDELDRYDKLIGHRDNATTGRNPDVILPDWFTTQYGDLLAQFNYG